jgi:Protein of unknown function (DUF1800)
LGSCYASHTKFLTGSSVEAKSFLGKTIPAGTSAADSLRIALDHLAAHPNVGPFIGHQLIRRLTTSNPSPALGQAALHSPSVFNFYRPGYVAPGTQSASRNLVAPELQILNETSVAGYVNYMRDSISGGVGRSAGSTAKRDLQGDYSVELALVTDVPALVDRVITRLTYGAIGTARRTEIINAINSNAIPGDGSQSQINTAKRQRVNAAVLLTVAAPEFVVIK